MSPRSPPAKFVVHQNCMKVNRARACLQLAITLVVHCGTNLGHILYSLGRVLDAKHNARFGLADFKTAELYRIPKQFQILCDFRPAMAALAR
ncbi:hypothetical protein LMG28690_03228 [Paraburkholderia caffeinilytica]|nr:hypothetical protein LMG28690_03228 [Paraburkholderia caffeinilytica]